MLKALFKNETFHQALMWLVVTAVTTYLGLTTSDYHDAFLYGVWSGINFANALLRFKKSYKQEKEKGVQ